MERWGHITYGILIIVVIIIVGIIIVRRRQKSRLKEARMRGIRQALEEQKQFDALRRLEGKKADERVYTVNEYQRDKRREIKR